MALTCKPNSFFMAKYMEFFSSLVAVRLKPNTSPYFDIMYNCMTMSCKSLNQQKEYIIIYLIMSTEKKTTSQCTKTPAMCGFWEKAEPQGFIVCSLNLHLCKSLFPRFEPVTSRSHGGNFTSKSYLQ